MTIGLVDTTVLIHYFRKLPAARQWVDNQPARLTITPMTWLEMMRGAPGKAGQATCKVILARFDMEFSRRPIKPGRWRRWNNSGFRTASALVIA